MSANPPSGFTPVVAPVTAQAADEALRAATAEVRRPPIWVRAAEELFTWFKTLASAAIKTKAGR